MKLIFLGTGAADWVAEDFIDGREYRRYTSAMIDDSLLIDPGPHIFHFADKNGTPNMFDNVKNVIVTHSHRDHFCSKTVVALNELCHPAFYGDAACLRKLKKELSEDELKKINFITVDIYSKLNIDGYGIEVFPSNHGTTDPNERTLHYVIERDGKKLFYGPDGGWLFYPVWRKLRSMHFDAMVLEATVGDVVGDDRIFGHNTLAMLELMLDTFKKQGCVDKSSKIICTHMAKTLHTDHASLVKRVAPLGMVPAYDGMIVEI